MAHIRLKPSKEIKIKFNPKELENIKVPEESKTFVQEYMKSKKLSDDDNLDMMLMFDDRILFGFDYLYGKTKRVIIEINPVTIFYSNSVMSFGMLRHYKDVLLSQATEVSQIGNSEVNVNLSHSAMYFQLAINCVINLQASLESFANRVIPENYPYIDKLGNPVKQTVTYKLYNALPKVKLIDFRKKQNRKYNISIDKLIQLRNDIVHLTPSGQTNTGYKGVYRDLLNFDFSKAILSVRKFVNFYEPDLIEECSCGKDFYFDSGQKI